MKKRRYIYFLLLSLICVLLFILEIVYGSVRIPLQHLMDKEGSYFHIIYNFRLPKAITAVVVGAGISVAGLLMQTLFRNPLAGPYVLGVSSGASLGVAVYLMAGSWIPAFLMESGWGLVISALLGAGAVLLMVLGVSFKVREAVSLLIVGMMFGQIAGSLVTILQNASSPDSLKLFVVWTFGSLSAVYWNYMWVMLPLILSGLLLALGLQKQLNALLLGENYARSLGISVFRLRFAIIVAVTLLAGASTAFTGPIAFIGIAVPHIARGIFSTSNHRILLPATMLCGSAILMLCDLFTQIPASGYVLPINAVSALVGAPMIIWIILKRKKIG